MSSIQFGVFPGWCHLHAVRMPPDVICKPCFGLWLPGCCRRWPLSRRERPSHSRQFTALLRSRTW